jgi:hypothetical protein
MTGVCEGLREDTGEGGDYTGDYRKIRGNTGIMREVTGKYGRGRENKGGCEGRKYAKIEAKFTRINYE